MADERKALRDSFAARLDSLGEAAQRLDVAVREALEGVKHIDRIGFRVKDPDKFVEKVLDRKTDPPYEQPLEEVEDQVAGRVMVFFIGDLEVVTGRLEQEFQAVEAERKQPERDDQFGYESDHRVFMIPPHAKDERWDEHEQMPETFELQVRTLFMHAWAEPQHDVGYKPGVELPREARRQLAWIAASAWGADQALEQVRRLVGELGSSADAN